MSKKASTEYYSLKPFFTGEEKVMSKLKRNILSIISLLGLLFIFSMTAAAQNISLRYFYKLDLSQATEAPTFPSGFPEFNYPEAARRNGVEGTLKIILTLGEDSKIKNLTVEQPLGFGVTEAITKDLEALRFQPAKRDGKPIAVKLFFDYIVVATYSESSKDVGKPKITDQPAAVYPDKYRAEKTKGKVSVTATFYPDGKLEINGVSSTMPKEFDRAATDAAKNIKFTPAVHKKSKKPVAQAMTIEYDFKP